MFQNFASWFILVDTLEGFCRPMKVQGVGIVSQSQLPIVMCNVGLIWMMILCCREISWQVFVYFAAREICFGFKDQVLFRCWYNLCRTEIRITVIPIFAHSKYGSSTIFNGFIETIVVKDIFSLLRSFMWKYWISVVWWLIERPFGGWLFTIECLVSLLLYVSAFTELGCYLQSRWTSSTSLWCQCARSIYSK